MTRFLKIFAKISLLPSTVVFLLFMVWAWSAVNVVFLAGGDELLSTENMQRSMVSQGYMSEGEAEQRLFVYKARVAFVILAGVIGWLAIYAGAARINQNIKAVPVAIKVGLLLGLAAVMIFPTWQQLSLVPVVSVVLLVAVWYRNTPGSHLNMPATRTGEST